MVLAEHVMAAAVRAGATARGGYNVTAKASSTACCWLAAAVVFAMHMLQLRGRVAGQAHAPESDIAAAPGRRRPGTRRQVSGGSKQLSPSATLLCAAVLACLAIGLAHPAACKPPNLGFPALGVQHGPGPVLCCRGSARERRPPAGAQGGGHSRCESPGLGALPPASHKLQPPGLTADLEGRDASARHQAPP